MMEKMVLRNNEKKLKQIMALGDALGDIVITKRN